jgi:hypothetical protein
MALALEILFAVLLVASSAIVTYFISISRERLWLCSKKSEELYYKVEETHHELASFFRDRYELERLVVFPRSGNELSALDRHIVDMKICVGLYFPALEQTLSSTLNAIGTGFDLLKLAEASDETTRERALHNLDFAVSNMRDSFEQFKKDILSTGRVEKIGTRFDALINRNRRLQAQRVLSTAV